MPARKPEEADLLWTEAMNSGNLEAAVALYERGASLVPQPGQVVTGIDAIRQALATFVALKPRITLQIAKTIQAGDIAFVSAKWSLQGTGPDGKEVNMTHRSTEVLRRQPDGNWLFIIDDPFSADR